MTATLQDLEARIAALEAQRQPDQLQANYLVVNADGTIGAVFPGGLQLNQGQSATPPPEEAIIWRAPGGQLDPVGNPPGEIGSATLQNKDELWVQAAAADGIEAIASLIAVNFQGAGQIVQLACNAAAQYGSSTSNITAQTETQNVTIIDDAGQSSFLQLSPAMVNPRQLAFSCGSTGGVGAGGATTVTHGLGRQPIALLGTNYWADSTSQASWTFYGANKSQFSAINKGPTSGALFWLAIG